MSAAGRLNRSVDAAPRDEFWFIATGNGTIMLGDAELDVQAGDIIYTAAGIDHDVLTVTSTGDLHIFWLSWTLPDGASGQHLHRAAANAARHLVSARRPA